MPSFCRSGKHDKDQTGLRKDGTCLECSRENSRKCAARRRAANPEKCQAERSAWRAANKDKVRAYNKKTYANGGKAWHLASKYGLAPEDFQQLLSIQHGLCAICAEVLVPGKKLHVDHDHSTGKVRGLLCQCCNHGLGMFKDSTTRVVAAERYLHQHTDFDWSHFI